MTYTAINKSHALERQRLAVNRDKPDLWKADTVRSVDFYNDWFLRFAPQAYRTQRVEATRQVEDALEQTANLTEVTASVLRSDPSVLPMLRMATAPPLARDRLIGLAGVPPGLVKSMEEGRLPARGRVATLEANLEKLAAVLIRLADEGIFPWIGERRQPAEAEVHRAATIVADRLCGSQANPIIRNAQEQRQLAKIKEWLEARDYSQISAGHGLKFDEMEPGTFSFRLIVPVEREDGGATTNIPVDAVIKPLGSRPDELPFLIEAKSAGDYANTNKRRKEEATKFAQLRRTYGKDVRFVLFLCGYFDSGYLGYEAAEGIDWVWEHRMDDLAQFGI